MTSHMTSQAASSRGGPAAGSSTLPSIPPTTVMDGTSLTGTSTFVVGSLTGSSIFNVTTVSGGGMSAYNFMEDEDADDETEKKFDPSKPNDHAILKLESLKDKLRIIERAVTQNIYQNKQARYRELPILPSK